MYDRVWSYDTVEFIEGGSSFACTYYDPDMIGFTLEGSQFPTAGHFLVRNASTLSGDFAPADCDVDGSDLAAMIANNIPIDVMTFAQNFGKNSCQ